MTEVNSTSLRPLGSATSPGVGLRAPSSAPAKTAGGEVFGADTLNLSARRASSTSEDRAEAVDTQSVARDLSPLFQALARDKAPFAIQQVRYADLVAGGRETHLVFEEDRGTLLPPVSHRLPPQVDHLTGDTNVALREARIRVSAGRYDVLVNFDGEGKPSFHKLMLDGRDITSVAGDWVKAKVKEDPLVWGSLAAATAAGALVAAHQHVARTGKPIEFNVGNVRLYRSEKVEVKLRPRAELTGTSSFVRPSGAELGATYTDGKLQTSAGVRYSKASESFEMAATLNYQVAKDTTLGAYASRNTRTGHTSAGILFQSLF